MARFSIRDPWDDESVLLCFPEAWQGMKDRIKELSGGKQEIVTGIGVRFLGSFQWESENSTSFVLTDILDFKAPPSLPEDRSSKKVKLSRSKKVKEEDVEEMKKEDLLDTLEEEAVDDGEASVDDDTYDFSSDD